MSRSTVGVGIPRGAISITTPSSPENPLNLG